MTRYTLVIDLERCTGCETCSLACRVENGIAEGDWMRVNTICDDGKDKPSGQYPDLSLEFLPQTCMHCASPPCVDACPQGAIQQRADGLVILEADDCNGCQECLPSCPYGAITFNEDTATAGKCNLCRHRIDAGLEPFCVVCCEAQAICFGDIHDPESEVSRVTAGRITFTLNPEFGTRPGVIYCAVRERLGL